MGKYQYRVSGDSRQDHIFQLWRGDLNLSCAILENEEDVRRSDFQDLVLVQPQHLRVSQSLHLRGGEYGGPIVSALAVIYPPIL